jgi:3',5'-cyclic AMP phosphodiesterase CpdA
MVASPDPIVIVHISDLHIHQTIDETFKNQFIDQVRNKILLKHENKIDLLVVSGDIIDKGADTYDNATAFLKELCTFNDSHIPILLVPGNHDRTNNPDLSSFNLFSNFLRDLKKAINSTKDVPKYIFNKKGKHYDIETLDNGGIIFLGLNSSYNSQGNAGFDMESLDKALNDSRINSNKPELKIAVWHHEPRFSSEPNSVFDLVLKRLQGNGFQILLHGHYHIARYPMSVAMPNRLGCWYTIPAGTFDEYDRSSGAEYSPSYNVIRIHKLKRSFRITVQVRQYIGNQWELIHFTDDNHRQPESEDEDIGSPYYEWQIPKSLNYQSLTNRKERNKEFKEALKDNDNAFTTMISDISSWIKNTQSPLDKKQSDRVVMVIGSDINSETHDSEEKKLPKLLWPPTESDMARFLDMHYHGAISQKTLCPLSEYNPADLPRPCLVWGSEPLELELPDVMQYWQEEIMNPEKDTGDFIEKEFFGKKDVKLPKPELKSAIYPMVKAIIERKNKPLAFLVNTCYDSELERYLESKHVTFQVLYFDYNELHFRLRIMIDGTNNQEEDKKVDEGFDPMQEHPTILRVHPYRDMQTSPPPDVYSEDNYIALLCGRRTMFKKLPEKLGEI